jgi:nickel superoxide dismutase
MLEHVATIEKSMQQIESLEKEEKANSNQLVRWVNNKDEHADELSEIVTFYFMAQRVKPTPESDKAAYAKYVHQLTTLHQMVVLAMKAKQTTDLTNCSELRKLVTEFRKSYMGE